MSTYHLVEGSVRVLWDKLKQMEYYTMLLEEHHKWKYMMWLVGSSPSFPSNLGILEGNLVEIFDQVGSCNMGSFINLVKSWILSDAKYGIAGVVPTMVCGRGGVFPCEDGWELVPYEEGWALPPCGGVLVGELF
jgi:hypothetical protein